MKLRRFLCGAALAVCLFAGGANAAVIFDDNFDDETAQLNQANFVNWIVANGTVDIVANDTFNINCVGNVGNCVDLDGSTFNAGDLVSQILFEPGDYLLTFDYRGNQRNDGTDTMLVTMGLLSESFSLSGQTGFSTVARSLTVGPEGDNLTFSHAGGDNIGLILDNVRIESAAPSPSATVISEPASLGLLATGLVGAGFIMRRRGSRSKESL